MAPAYASAPPTTPAVRCEKMPPPLRALPGGGFAVGPDGGGFADAEPAPEDVADAFDAVSGDDAAPVAFVSGDGLPDAVADEDDDALVADVGCGCFTSVALRSSVACGRFAPEASGLPASFAGSGLSIMKTGSPGTLNSDLALRGQGGRSGGV